MKTLKRLTCMIVFFIVTTIFLACNDEQERIEYKTETISKSIPLSQLIETQRVNLKNYAFCQCLGYCSEESDAYLLKDGSAGEFFSSTAYSFSAHETIDKLAKTYAKKEYSLREGRGDYCVLKCLKSEVAVPSGLQWQIK